jgi:hypothetical protein
MFGVSLAGLEVGVTFRKKCIDGLGFQEKMIKSKSAYI